MSIISADIRFVVVEVVMMVLVAEMVVVVTGCSGVDVR